MQRPRLEVGIYQIVDDAMLKANRDDGTGWDWCWADWRFLEERTWYGEPGTWNGITATGNSGRRRSRDSFLFVIPARAGIQKKSQPVAKWRRMNGPDGRLRGHDGGAVKLARTS